MSVLAWVGLLTRLVAPHPTHTSSAELAVDGRSLRVTVRVFADDAPQEDVPGYVADRFRLVDGEGARIRLTPAGTRREGDVLAIILEGRLEGALSGGSLLNAILTDRFADQVNVVRATYGRRTATLIFIRGDGPKALP